MLLRSIFFLISFAVISVAQGSTILVWGDSLSAAYQLRVDQGWPALLQTRLESQGFPHKVINASVSGETTSGGRTRLPAALDTHRPDILVLELGANDGLRGLPPRVMAENLDAMVRMARDSGARVLIAGMQMPPNYGPMYTRGFENAFRKVADENQVALLPFLLEGFADQPELFLPDGIHPNAEAQHLIVDTVWQHLLPLLNQTTSR